MTNIHLLIKMITIICIHKINHAVNMMTPISLTFASIGILQYCAKVMQTIIGEYCALFLQFITDISAKQRMDCRTLKLFFFQMQFYLQNEHSHYLQYYYYTYIYVYIALLILTLFIQANRTSTYTTYNTNILTFTLHCTAHTYTINTSTNYNTYNTISNHLIELHINVVPRSTMNTNGRTENKEKIIFTSVGIEPTTSGLDLPLLF